MKSLKEKIQRDFEAKKLEAESHNRERVRIEREKTLIINEMKAREDDLTVKLKEADEKLNRVRNKKKQWREKVAAIEKERMEERVRPPLQLSLLLFSDSAYPSELCARKG